MRVAACKYPLQTLAGFEDFAAKQRVLLAEAAAAGAELAVLPEYLGLELAGAQPPALRADLADSLAALQVHAAAWTALYAGLARDLRLWIQAGSFLLADGRGGYRNRAWLFGPGGESHWQDKLQLTGFERAAGCIVAGDALGVVECAGVRLGIAVCYDSEFPLPVRAQREAGAQLLLVPSCTDTAAGATRVRVGCLARALENRMAVACAVTAGALPWSPALDCNTGEAALLLPMDLGFPADGVLAETRGDAHWAIADLPLQALADPTLPAQVANERDWPGQLRPGLRRAVLR
ncbi:MAG: nitrilase [Xanthomonadales bacterium]|jgi:predicted amidohydrolase|nr:nitrilase [Xanthomonadales bacterium]